MVALATELNQLLALYASNPIFGVEYLVEEKQTKKENVPVEVPSADVVIEEKDEGFLSFFFFFFLVCLFFMVCYYY
jgi:hypothetical protein